MWSVIEKTFEYARINILSSFRSEFEIFVYGVKVGHLKPRFRATILFIASSYSRQQLLS